MSQAKVDRYKEEKKNRAKIMKKEKREMLLLKAAGTLVAVALVGWIGFSVYQNVHVEPAHTYQVKTEALDNYLNGLSSDSTETETEASGTEAESSQEETESEVSK